MTKYKQNLSIVSVQGIDHIQSYTTIVARIDHSARKIFQLGHWSVTTQKHIK
jgi:hypothetical protein